MTKSVTAPPACAATRARLMRHLIEDRHLLLCEALRVLGRRDRAEDVMQDAALRCLESHAIPDRIDSAPGFLRRMVRNLAIDQLRREARQPTETLEPDLDCASPADDPAGRLAGRQALRVVAEEACRADPLVDYFPSFEIVTGPQARGAFWAPGLREVTAEGVSLSLPHIRLDRALDFLIGDHLA